MTSLPAARRRLAFQLLVRQPVEQGRIGEISFALGLKQVGEPKRNAVFAPALARNRVCRFGRKRLAAREGGAFSNLAAAAARQASACRRGMVREGASPDGGDVAP
jgi:hypothetical protein